MLKKNDYEPSHSGLKVKIKSCSDKEKWFITQTFAGRTIKSYFRKKQIDPRRKVGYRKQ